MSKFIIIDRDTKEKVINMEFFTRKLAEFYRSCLSKNNRILEIKEI